MDRNEIISKLYELLGPGAFDRGPTWRGIIEILAEETPRYAFALREDLKNDKRFLPTRAEPKASGWDVRAAMADKQPIIVKPLQHLKIPLGFRSFCPSGWWFELKPRSSTFAKRHLNTLIGTIDETYEGENIFACQYIPEGNIIKPLIINFGDAVGQIIPIRRQEAKIVEWTNEEYNDACKGRAGARGDGGFGSTGR
jgi:dUTP pyrophosphatase